MRHDDDPLIICRENPNLMRRPAWPLSSFFERRRHHAQGWMCGPERISMRQFRAPPTPILRGLVHAGVDSIGTTNNGMTCCQEVDDLVPWSLMQFVYAGLCHASSIPLGGCRSCRSRTSTRCILLSHLSADGWCCRQVPLEASPQTTLLSR
jgi:hypothetical protein